MPYFGVKGEGGIAKIGSVKNKGGGQNTEDTKNIFRPLYIYIYIYISYHNVCIIPYFYKVSHAIIFDNNLVQHFVTSGAVRRKSLG